MCLSWCGDIGITVACPRNAAERSKALSQHITKYGCESPPMVTQGHLCSKMIVFSTVFSLTFHNTNAMVLHYLGDVKGFGAWGLCERSYLRGLQFLRRTAGFSVGINRLPEYEKLDQAGKKHKGYNRLPVYRLTSLQRISK